MKQTTRIQAPTRSPRTTRHTRNADGQSAVSPSGTRRASEETEALKKTGGRRLPTCETAECYSALRPRAGWATKRSGWALACLLASAFLAAAQYSIDWHTIDGGGGTSTGGAYSLSGTIGQPDAGPTTSGGGYSLTGGFWALPIAVQSSDAPTLFISPATPGFATVSWDPPMPGFVLQETVNLTAGWTNSPSGAANPITVPATLPARFYRLLKP